MDQANLTQLLNKDQRDLSAQQQVDIEAVYDHLKKIARSQRFKIKGTGINTTALVNEAWLKNQKTAKTFNDRNHFFAYSALAMRHILLNEARRNQVLTYVDDQSDVENPVLKESTYLLDLEKQLVKLKAFDSHLEQVFTYKFFGDMEFKDIAEVMDISERTVFRYWKKARAMLAVALQ
ncbi:siderophore-interacting protein [Marinicella pacifica]|uniref:Siderophore-interacting protein n=1 Tax=Marinicella pacifica TaxID=1171543 RepID=A0A917CVB1_9GAMM|nr:sigma-70 family RNA polymerase sigma factor [Marinicella pacifica]GGF97914.1 siderophore-interacting protein [Marinicella pacifica]